MGEEEARPVCRHHSACPTGPCRRGGRPGDLPNLLMEKEKKEDEEKIKNYEKEEQLEGKRRKE